MERKFRITVDGREYSVAVEEVTEGSHLTMPEPGSMQVPRPESAATSSAASAPSAPAAAKPGDEVSPLAGVVQSIEVKVGQAVQEGEHIASIEAMKMVTKVVAHKTGKVASIAVQAGDAVDAGQTLLSIA